MRCSGLISLLVLLVAGCVSIKPLNLGPANPPVTRHALRITQYVPPGKSQLYKATLDIKKHHLSGLVMIKRMEPKRAIESRDSSLKSNENSQGNYRIVFMNEVGMTFFDLELDSAGLKVISCFESLNKKALMNIFETDFRLLMDHSSLKGEKQYLQNPANNLVNYGRLGKYKVWQTWSPGGDTLRSLRAKSTIADPSIITFDNYSDGKPLKIIIENPFIGMKLSLRKLVQ